MFNKGIFKVDKHVIDSVTEFTKEYANRTAKETDAIIHYYIDIDADYNYYIQIRIDNQDKLYQLRTKSDNAVILEIKEKERFINELKKIVKIDEDKEKQIRECN